MPKLRSAAGRKRKRWCYYDRCMTAVGTYSLVSGTIQTTICNYTQLTLSGSFLWPKLKGTYGKCLRLPASTGILVQCHSDSDVIYIHEEIRIWIGYTQLIRSTNKYFTCNENAKWKRKLKLLLKKYEFLEIYSVQIILHFIILHLVHPAKLEIFQRAISQDGSQSYDPSYNNFTLTWYRLRQWQMPRGEGAWDIEQLTLLRITKNNKTYKNVLCEGVDQPVGKCHWYHANWNFESGFFTEAISGDLSVLLRCT